MSNCASENPRTGMADAVLRELVEALEEYAHNGTHYVIDLKSLPMSPGDLEELEQVLGRGEVHIELDVVGKSEIWETRYAGLWWVRHRGADAQVITENLEIARIPAVVCSHPEDMNLSHQRLRDAIVARTTDGEESIDHE